MLTKNIQRAADLLFALNESYNLINFEESIKQIEDIFECLDQLKNDQNNLQNYLLINKSLIKFKNILWEILGIKKYSDNIEEKMENKKKIIFSDSYIAFLDILSIKKDENSKIILNILEKGNKGYF
ncbi:hypothetical protein Mgra_00002910 [Meloidogyne graminicola]|uniref:Uncharacterized protein n=1 Tax=Meloidogyne graminicola TaxID=189291 RepID=A0A8S9ZVC6_9BILA|nr:hypothetical protein Mgra_00002910 [Meloidogyne graminicola]